MRRLIILTGIVALMAAPAVFSPAWARAPFGAAPLITSPANYPGAPKKVYDDDKAPYAMNYADEAAQALGVRNRHLDVFTAKPAGNSGYLPSLIGGVGGDGAMLKLQWHPGE